MSLTYYQILGVTEEAPESDISAKFRVLALNYHPERNKASLAYSNFAFHKVCEAYEVLSNCKSTCLIKVIRIIESHL